MKTTTTMTADTPPFPRLGEIYQVLALALDTKNKNRDIDSLARKGDYDWSLLPTLYRELISEPLEHYTDANFAALVEQFVSHVHASYLQLVATVSLDSLSREEALPLLVEHYFSVHACGLLLGIHKEFGGPDLLALLDAEASPLSVVLNWAGSVSADTEVNTLAKIAFPETEGTDKTGREMLNRWIDGKQLPDISNIKLFVRALKDRGFIQHVNLCRWLVVARALAWLEKRSPIPLHHVMRQHLLLGLRDFDVGTLLSHAVHEEGKKLSPLSMPALMLIENLKRTTPKLAGDKARTKADLQALQRLVEQHDLESRTQFHLEWLQGRWHVLAGELKEALRFYKQAARLVNYRGGEAQKKITEEALVIAGYLDDKVFLNQLKHRAIAFNLFTNPNQNDVVEKWEIAQFRQQFHHIFPLQGRFPEVASGQIDGPELPFLAFSTEKVDKMKADLRNPNRVITQEFLDGQTRRSPQLSIFASIGRLDEVTKLLAQDASVDHLDESNGSALLCAIQHAEQTGERAVLDLLLKQPHAKETLNKATDKKRLTPLMCAIDYGQPDVVEQLLKMGASADKRGLIENLTPLYRTLGQMALLKSPETLYAHLHELLKHGPTLLQQESFRRHNVSFAGVFGDGAGWAEMLKNPRHQALFTSMVEVMLKLHNEQHSSAKLHEIVRLLLAHGANPNVPHASPAPGRTPLMLAAENNAVEILELMLNKYRGDPSIQDKAGKNCMQIALGFGSGAVVRYLHANGIR